MPFQLPDLPYRQGCACAAHVGRDARVPPRQAPQGLCHQDQRADRERSGPQRRVADRRWSAGASASGNAKLFNNSAQLWNHSFFWQCLAPAQGQQPDGKLAQADRATASATPRRCSQKLQEEAVNHFSNGWAWLVLDRGKLRVTSLHDADTPVVHEGMVPLFTLDVWEHAYYIDYRNERPRFASTVLANIVNWDFVAQNLDGQGFERANQEGARIARAHCLSR